MLDTGSRRIVVPALIAAVLAASAWVSIPLGSVPLTMQLLIVVLAALVLRPRQAAAALGVYLLLGAIGVPVFAGGRGGLGVLLGPTGGYLWGFWLGAVLGACVRSLLARRRWRGIAADACAAATVLVIVYLLGWLQLAVTAGMSPWEAFAAGVAPFVLPDAVKAAVAVAVARVLRRSAVV